MKPQNKIEIYVSVNGSDETGNGSLDRPFRSVEQAQLALQRIIREDGLSGDAYIRIMGGTYYLTAPILIGPKDWSREHQIIYTNHNGEEVHLVGGIPVTGWAGPDRDGVFSADVTNHSDFYALYENGKLMTSARCQNWADLSVRDSSHLQAVYGNITSWFGEVLKVSHIDGDNVFTVYKQSTFSGELQYLQGAREYIKETGDWAIESGKLYCKPYDPAHLEQGKIIAGATQKIFHIQGLPDQPVKNIVIRGLHLEMADFGEDLQAHAKGDNTTVEFDCNLQGMVTMEYAENITVENCSMENAGYVGVVLRRHCQNNTIRGNRIQRTGYAGIFMIGDDPGSSNYYNHSNVITNNKIQNVGQFVGHGAGIYLINSGDNQITHNDISYVPRYGISLKGIRFGVFGDNGLGHVSFDDHWQYNQTTRNYIGYNRVYNTGIRSGDGGGIEGWGMGRDNWIDHNIIYNAYRGAATPNWRGHSIFLDDAAHYTTVTGNIIYDENAVAVNAGIFIKSIHNHVVNNVFDVSYAKNGAADIMPYICPAGGSVFEKNIVYASAAGTLHLDGSHTSDGNGDRIMFYISDSSNFTDTSAMDSLVSMDNNVYYNAVGTPQFRVDDDLLTLEEWKRCPKNRNGYDAGSILADPLFVDAPNHDYRLRPDSPALKLGIESIESETIGLLPDYPFPET